GSLPHAATDRRTRRGRRCRRVLVVGRRQLHHRHRTCRRWRISRHGARGPRRDVGLRRLRTSAPHEGIHVTQRITITDTNLGDSSIERSVLEPEFDVELLNLQTEDEVIAAAQGSVGLLVQWAPLTERAFAALPDLRAVVRYGIGLDNIDLAAA